MPRARASTSARSLSDTMSWSRSCGDSSRRPKKAMTTTHHAHQAGDDELVLPRVQVRKRAGGDDTRRQASHRRPQGPEAHGRAAPHLGREVAHECRGGHEDDALDESDHAVGEREAESAVDVRNGHQLDEPDGERAVDRQVGPTDLVGEASDEGGEGADGVRHHQQVEEVVERHVVVGQQQRRDGALHVVQVVEDDRGEHHDRQVAPTCGAVRGSG